MDIYDCAMHMEKDGAKFYRELAGKCKVKGIKAIFVMLADEEAKHLKIINQLWECGANTFEGGTSVLENVKEVFAQMRKKKKTICIDYSDLGAYRDAMAIEAVTRRFYMEKAHVAEEEGVRKVFLSLAGQEAMHLRIMENVIEFITRPESGKWIEHVEWQHLDEKYVGRSFGR